MTIINPRKQVKKKVFCKKLSGYIAQLQTIQRYFLYLTSLHSVMFVFYSIANVESVVNNGSFKIQSCISAKNNTIL